MTHLRYLLGITGIGGVLMVCSVFQIFWAPTTALFILLMLWFGLRWDDNFIIAQSFGGKVAQVLLAAIQVGLLFMTLYLYSLSVEHMV